MVAALRALGHSVEHIIDHFPRCTEDVVFLPFVGEKGEKGWYLVTQDKRIKKKPHERAALMGSGVGALILSGRAEKTTDEMAIQLLLRIPEFIRLTCATSRPFIFAVPDRGWIERLGR